MSTSDATINDLLTPARAAAIEQLIDGGVHPLIEIRIYAQCTDFSWTAKAVEEQHIEQWALPLEGTGMVHGTLQCINKRRHVLTTSILRASAVDTVRSDISMDQYHHLSQACITGYSKKRYICKSDPQSQCGPFVVDVFLTNGGAPSLWVKIDIQVKDIHATIPELPFEPTSLIVANSTDLSALEEAQIKRLWSQEWQQIDPTRGEARQS